MPIECGVQATGGLQMFRDQSGILVGGSTGLDRFSQTSMPLRAVGFQL